MMGPTETLQLFELPSTCASPRGGVRPARNEHYIAVSWSWSQRARMIPAGWPLQAWLYLQALQFPFAPQNDADSRDTGSDPVIRAITNVRFQLKGLEKPARIIDR